MIDGDEPQVRTREPNPVHPTFVRSALIFYGVMGCVALIWRMATPGESILHPSPEAAANAKTARGRCQAWVTNKIFSMPASASSA